ncbi:MAG: methyltransferase domain-containing protein [Syntrophomonas sp.]|nr:methyltransferase domain-containing protein [Syntrophomonas sp.]
MKGLVNWEALQKLAMAPMMKQMDQNPAEMWGKSAIMYNQMAQLEVVYTRNQLDHLLLGPADSVLDIGCGPGRLAVPIAQRCARVTALDVAPAMLEVCQDNARRAGVTNLETRLLNWEEAVVGDNIEQHDVVIASRSVGMRDLVKLNQVARKHVFILSFARSPSLKEARDSLFRDVTDDVLDLPPANRMLGYNIIFNMLYDMGIDPSVKVVPDGFTRDYRSRLEAYDDLRQLGHFPSEKEEIFRCNVDRWLTANGDGSCTFRIETRTYIIGWPPQDLDL